MSSVEKDLPLVSVIIPVYNMLPYLRDALDSVIKQSYPNLEILVIDDESTDGSEKICDEYMEKDPRIKVTHQNNQGLSGARNTGLKIMTGEITAFLDADDMFHTDMVSAMVRSMEKNRADIIVCRFDRGKALPPDSEFSERVYSSHEVFGLLFERKMGFSVSNKLFRRELWSGLEFPLGRNFEDTAIFHLLLYRARRVCFLNERLVKYRNRPDSITHTYSVRNVRDWLWAVIQMPQFINDHMPAEFTEAERDAAFRSAFRRTMGKYNRLYYLDPQGSAQARKILREAIIEFRKEVRRLSFSDRMGYRIIRDCPLASPFIWQIVHVLRNLYKGRGGNR